MTRKRIEANNEIVFEKDYRNNKVNDMGEIENLKRRLANISEIEAKECNALLDQRKVRAITVGELLCSDYSFFIPNYQRGYRWTKLEVQTLLKDIEKASNGMPHCLQPLVIQEKKRDNGIKYTVIDGQQRLTTISIILAWCAGNAEKRPSIEYETRNDSEKFLRDIGNEEKRKLGRKKNIDFYYMDEAYEECARNPERDPQKIKDHLLKNCYFILYIAKSEEKEHKIFKRLNTGKIALSNAELTKAWLLHGLEEQEQFKRALMWDEMSALFEKDDFWYFICPEPDSERYKQTRLDYLIECTAGINQNQPIDRYESFRSICEKAPEETWGTIKSYYNSMKYWYEDIPCGKGTKSFYHLIGFIISLMRKTGVKGGLCMRNVLADFCENSKSKFRELYTKKIVECFLMRGDRLSDVGDDKKIKVISGACGDVKIYDLETYLSERIEKLNYLSSEDKPIILNILLLMNIATLELNYGENSKYPFYSHVKENWSLEHIHARNECTDEHDEYLSLLTKDEMSNLEKYKEEQDRFLNEPTTYDPILRVFEERYGNDGFNYIESFGNLALLPKKTNSKFNNKTYRKKREIISKMSFGEIEPSMLPICTRYAFYKYYSPSDTSNIIWDGKNASDYKTKCVTVICKYINNL